MSNSSPPYDDASRLEAALERIALLHRRGVTSAGAAIPSGAASPDIGIVAARLDHLIADLKQLLKPE